MRRPLYGWLAADAFSLTGTRVSMVALPLFALETTGSAALTGAVAAAETAPLVACKLLAGPVIDRIGARRVAITCDVASVVAIGAIPLLHHLGALSFPLLLVLVALVGALRGPGDGAKHALTPALVEEAGVPMERATGLHSVVERTASMLGAGVAGILVATIGAADTLALNAAALVFSAAVLAWATAPLTTADAPPGDPDPTPYLRQLREGWDFLRRDRVLVALTLMVAVTNLLDAAWTTVLMPVWSVESGRGAAVLGLLFAVFSGASAIGAVVAAAWADRLPRYPVYLVCFLVCGAPRFAVLAFGAPLAGVVAVFVVGGFAAGFLNPVLGAVIFERIPRHLVGRVSSLTTSICWSLMPFGGLLGGALIGAGGLTVAFLVVGVAYLLATLAPAVDPRWREIDRRPAPAASDPIAVDTPARAG